MSDLIPDNAPKLQPQSSWAVEAYVQQALQLLELNIPPEQLPSIVENFERVRTIAQPVLDFPLPDNLEAAPTFEP